MVILFRVLNRLKNGRYIVRTSAVAELMKHRDSDDSKQHHVHAKEFICYNIDIDILEELLSLGNLGIQYCLKSKAAYTNLKEKDDGLLAVPYAEFNERYNERDITARKNMRNLVDSAANKVTKVFSTLIMR